MIAVKVIDHFKDVLKIPLAQGGKRSLFLVNTVCLGKQVAAEIKTLLGLEVACWNSETHKKSWNKERYNREFNECQVFVATAQLFLDAIKHSFISISQLNLIIFDECHHGRMNHPYHEFMKQFAYVNPSEYPRIIGLSAMLVGISSKITEETVEKELEMLESTFLSTIVTVNRMDEYKNVLLHSTNPREGFLKFDVTEPCELVTQLFEKVSEIRWNLSLIKVDSIVTINPQTLRRQSKPKKVKELLLLFEDFKYELEQMGIYGGYLSLQAIRVQFELVKVQPNQQSIVLQIVKLCLKSVDELMKMIEDVIDVKNLSAEGIIENSNLKVRMLIAILQQKFNNVDRVADMQCLVFMQRRFTAKCFYHLFKRYAELDSLFPIKADFVVGVNSELPESIDEVLSLNYNKFAIERFRMKETNLICTSSVLEVSEDKFKLIGFNIIFFAGRNGFTNVQLGCDV